MSKRVMTSFKSGIFCICFIFLFNGCILSDYLAPIIPAQLMKPDSPRAKITEYSDALKNIGDIITRYGGEPIHISVQTIENKTAARGLLPNDITMMVESSLAKIGPNVLVIPYETSAISRILKKGKLLYVLRGAITEFDADFKTKSGGVNLGGFYKDSDAEGGIGDGVSLSSITLDFTLLDVLKGHYVPGLQVSNSMQVVEVTRSNDIAFSIQGNGLGVNGSATFKQGVHSILRLLVELSMVEILGKFRDYPYWIAIYNGKPDSNIIKKMTVEFGQFSYRERVLRIQKMLRLLYPEIEIDGINGKVTRQLIRKYKKKNRLYPINGKASSKLYKNLLMNSHKLLGV